MVQKHISQTYENAVYKMLIKKIILKHLNNTNIKSDQLGVQKLHLQNL